MHHWGGVPILLIHWVLCIKALNCPILLLHLLKYLYAFASLFSYCNDSHCLLCECAIDLHILWYIQSTNNLAFIRWNISFNIQHPKGPFVSVLMRNTCLSCFVLSLTGLVLRLLFSLLYVFVCLVWKWYCMILICANVCAWECVCRLEVDV